MSVESRIDELIKYLPLALSQLLANTLNDEQTALLIYEMYVYGQKCVDKFIMEFQGRCIVEMQKKATTLNIIDS